MMLQAGCAGLQCLINWQPAHGVAAAAMLIAWFVTFTLSVPCHRLLQKEGRRDDVISRLVQTNWLRTAGWTVVWIAGVYALFPMR
jgi:hypothetical protein